MTGHHDPLPWGQARVQLAAHHLQPAPQRFDLTLPGVGSREQLERLDLFQNRRDRLFEVKYLWGH